MACKRPITSQGSTLPPTPGRWVWGDLVTSDVAAAAEFYGKVFGWTYETYGGDDDRDTYTLALADGLPIGVQIIGPHRQSQSLLAYPLQQPIAF